MPEEAKSGATWLVVWKVALLYVFFIIASVVMAVIGAILLPLGLVSYLVRLPFRRRVHPTAG